MSEFNENLDNYKMVLNRIKRLGVVETFKNYSTFDEIEDKEFHKLRKYLITHIDLMDFYLKKKINEIETKKVKINE